MTNGNGNTTNDSGLFVPAQPGDLITSEKWNDLQKLTKKHISEQIEGLRQNGVDNAKNAEKLEQKSLNQITADLEDKFSKEFATINHDHEKSANYRRIFIRAEWNKWSVVTHNLGRYPMAEVYSLVPLPGGLKPFCVCHSTEFNLLFTEIKKIWPFTALLNGLEGSFIPAWGASFETILNEYSFPKNVDHAFGDYITEFFSSPEYIRKDIIGVTPMEYFCSPWVMNQINKPVKEVQSLGLWDEVSLLFVPCKIEGQLSAISGVSLWQVQLDYNRIAIAITAAPNQKNQKVLAQPANLMLLLRA